MEKLCAKKVEAELTRTPSSQMGHATQVKSAGGLVMHVGFGKCNCCVCPHHLEAQTINFLAPSPPAF